MLTLSAGLNTNPANPTSRVESLFSGPIRPKAATGGGVATLKNKFPPYFFVPPIRVVFSLLLVLLLSSRVKSQEYILLLNPGDCFKSNVAFAELQHFLNNHQIRVALLTPFEDQINAKLLMDKFKLNLTDYKVIYSLKLFKKYNNEANNSKLIIKYENKIIFNETIAGGIDTTTIPILKIKKPTEIQSFQIKNQLAPFYANEAVLFNKQILLKNLIYQKLYLQEDSSFIDFVLPDSIYNHILNKKFLNDTILIDKQRKFAAENNLERVKFLGLYSSDYLYTIIEIPVIGTGGNVYDPSYHLVKMDTNFSITATNEIKDDFDYFGNRFWSAYIFDFAVDPVNNRLLLFITKGHDNSNISPSDSALYILASYALLNDIFVFDSLHKHKLPAYYIDNDHFYRNLWPKIDLNPNSGGWIGFQYLNEMKSFNGESIKLNGLNSISLELPYQPGGKSIIPFEIITFKCQNNLLNILVWEKNKTWLCTYTLQGNLVKKQPLLKSILKPAVAIHKNQLYVVKGSLNGTLSYSVFDF